jgi:hypothetical protein
MTAVLLLCCCCLLTEASLSIRWGQEGMHLAGCLLQSAPSGEAPPWYPLLTRLWGGPVTRL